MDFPIIAQLLVAPFRGFEFCLPEVDYGRGDIRLSVEYSDAESKGRILVKMWIEIAGDRVRGFLTSFEFDKYDDEDVQINKLIEYINQFQTVDKKGAYAGAKAPFLR